MKTTLLFLSVFLSASLFGQKHLIGTNFWNCTQDGPGHNCENYLVLNQDSSLANGYYTDTLVPWQFEDGFGIPRHYLSNNSSNSSFGISKQFLSEAQFIIVKCYFKDGQLNGLFQVYYENVFKILECELSNNKLDGFLTKYNQLQNKIAHVNFKNGILHGNCTINDINNPMIILFQGDFQNGYSSKVNPYQLREDGIPYPYFIEIQGVRFIPDYEKNEEIIGFNWVMEY